MKFKANDYTKGEIIRILREWTELTQKDFGAAIGKSSMSIKGYEREQTNYGIDVLLEIARKFNITITIEKK
ncbi:MAG: helix-turn-helix domain-containing protein [Oscillospiraceae bacterium]|nr:helix-turn-helix domain-containing protein [Oscillospiraceae bacterium]